MGFFFCGAMKYSAVLSHEAFPITVDLNFLKHRLRLTSANAAAAAS